MWNKYNIINIDITLFIYTYVTYNAYRFRLKNVVKKTCQILLRSLKLKT